MTLPITIAIIIMIGHIHNPCSNMADALGEGVMANRGMGSDNPNDCTYDDGVRDGPRASGEALFGGGSPRSVLRS